MRKFTFSYPVFVCARQGVKDGDLQMAKIDDGLAVMVFTDEDLAQRFCEAKGSAAWTDIVEIDSRENFVGFCRDLMSKGATHVVFDGSGGSVTHNAIPIEDLLEQDGDEQ